MSRENKNYVSFFQEESPTEILDKTQIGQMVIIRLKDGAYLSEPPSNRRFVFRGRGQKSNRYLFSPVGREYANVSYRSSEIKFCETVC